MSEKQGGFTWLFEVMLYKTVLVAGLVIVLVMFTMLN